MEPMCKCGHPPSKHRAFATFDDDINTMCDEFGCSCMEYDALAAVPAIAPPVAARSRFAAIVEELDVESGKVPLLSDSLGVVAAATDRAEDGEVLAQCAVSETSLGKFLVCTRCGLNAFTPETGGIVACRACELPAPRYKLPPGFMLEVNRYRCSGCGKQSQVTMSLSDVNLYCGGRDTLGCGRLSLHVKQVDKISNARSPRVVVQGIPAPKPGGYITDLIDNSVKIVRPDLSEPAPEKVYPKLSETLLKQERRKKIELRWNAFGDVERKEPADVALAWQQTVDSLRVTLGFKPFREFEMEARRRNANNPEIRTKDMIRTKDIERGTGRTVKGLIESIAWCVVKKKPKLWVRSGTSTHDDWLVKEARDFIAEAGIRYPDRVRPCPRDKYDLPIPGDTFLYIDHHFIDGPT